ncbi:tryptophan 7-halogenase [Sphingosinithalassobacter tenebrarum]|uniref:Tryptophan 7-halogenase n=1 Tax=Stakelama tenebrarum TaxID=2711215 RepID=A0A6G6YB15_9SPHN|nr:tryptophan 7-halogenase [Sphingosinithalassobacter tenebrarum]
MARNILIVGGGTAGWITAGYLAKMLGAERPGGVSVTLVESPDIGILGVGEGTFPTIRKTLARIGIDEADLIRRCDASFKQGAKFVHWQAEPGTAASDHYLHGFQTADDQNGPELLPYWLLGMAGDARWDEAATPQKRAGDACRGPKLPSHSDFVGPLNYAYHFDAKALAVLLREQAIANSVRHIADTVSEVALSDDGAIAGVRTAENGVLTADLYIDCTGFRAELIGKALGQPWTSCRDTLFCDSAIAMQIPYDSPDAPIASYTVSTAQQSGWIWDIALGSRRGVGHVFSSAHTDADAAEAALRAYAGPAGEKLETRSFRFDAGYRETNWHKNCVAIGLSSGFFEPLEATGIVFSEIAAQLVANLFPWGGDFETSARQYNANLRARYERARDFIKMHYFLSQRRDSDFWRDNVRPETTPDSLMELLDRWRFRPPNELDFDPNIDIFGAPSWQYVLYGMGWKTDLSAKAPVFRLGNEARAAFATIRQHGDYALQQLPTNRDLLRHAQNARFGQGRAA